MKGKLIIVFVLAFGISKAQDKSSIWVFGDSAGIDFSTLASPIPISSGMDGRGSCSSVSDSLGSLLFYSYTGYSIAGVSTVVMTKNHQVMEGGDSLVGEGWYEENVIIPVPNSSNMYYLFSVGEAGFWPYGLYYSIVDMNQNGGLGKITAKNIQLISQQAFDGITAIKHGNGRDWWLVFKLSGNVPGANNDFYIYLISPSGITSPSIQSIGFMTQSGAGYISFSKSGDKLSLCTWNNLLEVFDFDRCSGLLSYPQIIELENPSADGEMRCTAFSPNGNFLYRVSNYGKPNSQNGYLIQYDITATNISASKDTIYTFVAPAIPGALKLGPDDKMYVTTGYDSYYPYPDSVRNYINENLSVINSPDSLGAKCDFQPFSFYLGGKRTYYGLPNNPDYEMGPWVGSFCDTILLTDEIKAENLPLSVYPNPFYNKITLQPFYGSGERIVINVFNSVGEIVYTKNSTLQLQEVDLNELAKGVYLLKIETKDKSFVKSLVKL